MTSNHLLAVSSAVALTAMLAGTAASQSTSAVTTKPPKVAFLTPLPPRFVIPPGDPRQPSFCRQLQPPATCPARLVYGGGLPTIDPAFKAELPNVRVSMVVQTMSNVAVANGGVEANSDRALWWTITNTGTVPIFLVNESGTSAAPLPPFGEPDDEADDRVIYEAIAFGACENLSSFHIDYTASIREGGAFGAELGAFHGVDTSTLDATGFYNFSHTIHATAADGGVSDFHLSGKVNVTCTAATTLF
jgi:hypothetical protein